MPAIRKTATIGTTIASSKTKMRSDDYRVELPPSSFDTAAARAMARFSRDQWALLESSKRTQAIYAELRRIDAGFTTALAAE